MIRSLVIASILFLTSMPAVAQQATAQQVAASPEAFAQCSALAEAAAIQHRTVIKDPTLSASMQAVADGYRTAANIRAGNTSVAKQKIDSLIKAKVPFYSAKLKRPEDNGGIIFSSDAKACGQIEQQAAALLQKFTAGQAKK